MQTPLHVAYIGLGANLGDPRSTIQAAISALGSVRCTSLREQSSLYETAPVDATGDTYINAVVELITSLTAEELLRELQHIEQQFGRVRSYQNAPRTLDCDLLLYDQQVLATPELIIPHPRMHQRAFVLVPLTEIAPGIVIPQLGAARALLPRVAQQTIQKLLK